MRPGIGEQRFAECVRSILKPWLQSSLTFGGSSVFLSVVCDFKSGPGCFRTRDRRCLRYLHTGATPHSLSDMISHLLFLEHALSGSPCSQGCWLTVLVTCASWSLPTSLSSPCPLARLCQHSLITLLKGPLVLRSVVSF